MHNRSGADESIHRIFWIGLWKLRCAFGDLPGDGQHNEPSLDLVQERFERNLQPDSISRYQYGEFKKRNVGNAEACISSPGAVNRSTSIFRDVSGSEGDPNDNVSVE